MPDPATQQTLGTYIVVLAALCGGLATWLVTGWVARWAGRKRDKTSATDNVPPASQATDGRNAG